MCLIPLSLLSQQREVHARRSWGWKWVFVSVQERQGGWFGLDVVTKTTAKERVMGWHHTPFTSNQTDPLYQTSTPKTYFFICSFHQTSGLDSEPYAPPRPPPPAPQLHPQNCPWNSTAVFVITSSALIDVCGDLLIFHEFPLFALSERLHPPLVLIVPGLPRSVADVSNEDMFL